MIYEAYEAQTDLVDLFRPLAAGAGQALRLPWPVLRTDWPTRLLAGALETFANLTVTHARPSFGIKSISVGDRLLAVTEEAATSTPPSETHAMRGRSLTIVSVACALGSQNEAHASMSFRLFSRASPRR